MFFLRIRPLLLAVVLGFGSFLGAIQAMPVAGAAAVADAGPPPACRYDDVLTEHTAFADWSITLLDTIYMLPKSYVPPKLVSTSEAGLNSGGQVRRFVIADLAAMAQAARDAHAGLRVVSAYRSVRSQARLYQREIDRYGLNKARHSVARPGHSEHQLGTTIDFGAAKVPGDVSREFAQTAAGHWMKDNAWKFGWVMSYPKGETSMTCYAWEPWHFRYVGRDLAAKIHETGTTLREYLWRHYQ